MPEATKLLMAFDFGLAQIGVATGNTLTQTEAPLTVLRAKNGTPDWSQIESLLIEWKPDLLLVGNPVNMDGTESNLSQRAKKFANQLSGRFNIEHELVDERLTSRDVKNSALEIGHSGDFRDRPLDAHAAGLLIRQWLNVSSSS